MTSKVALLTVGIRNSSQRWSGGKSCIRCASRSVNPLFFILQPRGVAGFLISYLAAVSYQILTIVP